MEWASNNGKQAILGVELSGNGGTICTLTDRSSTLETKTDTNVTFGGPNDLWGRTSWSTAELSASLFKVRLEAIDVTSFLDVDQVAVKVYYTTVPPDITNASGATGVTLLSAALNGQVVAGVPTPSATVYWGPTDGGTTKAAWSNAVSMGSQSGAFSTNVTLSGVANRTYSYRCYATNAVGQAWASSSSSFTTPLAVAAFSNMPYVVTESGGSVTITVALSAQPATAVSVAYATSNGTATASDYTTTNGVLRWSAGDTTPKTFSVVIKTGGGEEPSEVFYVALSSPTNCTVGGAQPVTIVDDDGKPTVEFSSAASSGSEATTPAALAVTLSRTYTANVTVSYAAVGGTATGGGVDYTLNTGVATIAANTLSTSISIPINNDTSFESNETVVVRISSPTNAFLGSLTNHTFTIIDNEVRAPVVQNERGATAITAHGATLHGQVTDTGRENPAVTFYWGRTDGGTARSAWSNSVAMGTRGLTAFASNITYSVSNVTYYYRCYATNSGGYAWASQTESFFGADPTKLSPLVNTSFETNGTVTIDAAHWTRTDADVFRANDRPRIGSYAMTYSIHAGTYIYGSGQNLFRLSWSGLYGDGSSQPQGFCRPGYVLNGSVYSRAKSAGNDLAYFTYRWRNIDTSSDWMILSTNFNSNVYQQIPVARASPLPPSAVNTRYRPEIIRDSGNTADADIYYVDDATVEAATPRLDLRPSPTQAVHFADTVMLTSTNTALYAKSAGGGSGTVLYGAYITSVSDLTNAAWNARAWYEVSDPSNAFSIVAGETLVATNDDGWHAVSVRFTPPGTGTYTGLVRIATTDPISHFPGGGTIYNTIVYEQYTLVGRGLESPPSLGAGPATLNFDAALGSTPAIQSFGVTNIGGQTLRYTNTVTYGSGWGGGVATVAPATGSLAAAASRFHTVSLGRATSVGTFYATNDITGNQVNGTQDVRLHLTVTNLPNPTALSTLDRGTRDLTVGWTRPGSYNVMIVRRQGADPDAPAPGTSYSHNATYGPGSRNQVVYAAGAAASDTDDGLVPQTVYHYGFFTENNAYYSPGAFLATTTLTAEVDGNLEEWTGVLPPAVNASTISSNEFIWRDKAADERQDSADDSDVDLGEFRIRADATHLYFLVTLRDITDVGRPYIALAVDTDRNAADTGLDWMADESGTRLGGGYDAGGNAGLHYAERNLIVHAVPGTGPVVEVFTEGGSTWSAPSGAAANISASGNFLEFKVPRSDLGLGGSVTARLSVASYHNDAAVSGANGGDTTEDYPIQDALDSLAVLPYGTNDASGTLASWDEDLSDGDVDTFFDVRLGAAGLGANQPPSAPSLGSGDPAIVFPTQGTVFEPGTNAITFNWPDATDADDQVTGYFLEVAAGTSFGGGENLGIAHRVNTPRTQTETRATLALSAGQTYAWRVRARDLSGALSGCTTNTFTVAATDDDVTGPTPEMVYVGETYTPGLEQTNITDEALANTNDRVDIAVRWSDPSGVFMTNHPPHANSNLIADDGRVVPNWDLYATNTVTGAAGSSGYHRAFSAFLGANGHGAVTTVYYNAFAVTNISLNSRYYLKVGGEDEDNDRGTMADPQGDGDDIPLDRAVTSDRLVRFNVTDDDSAGPVHSSFAARGQDLDGASYDWRTLVSGGLAVSGYVQDVGSGVYGGATNRFVLSNATMRVSSGPMTTALVNGDAKSSPGLMSTTVPANVITNEAFYTLTIYSRDYDRDRADDSVETATHYRFRVTHPGAEAPGWTFEVE